MQASVALGGIALPMGGKSRDAAMLGLERSHAAAAQKHGAGRLSRGVTDGSKPKILGIATLVPEQWPSRFPGLT